MTSKLLAVCAVLASSLLLAACENTVRGAAQDIQETERAVEDVVE